MEQYRIALLMTGVLQSCFHVAVHPLTLPMRLQGKTGVNLML